MFTITLNYSHVFHLLNHVWVEEVFKYATVVTIETHKG